MAMCRIYIDSDTVFEAYDTRKNKLISVIESKQPNNPKQVKGHIRKIKNAQQYLYELEEVEPFIIFQTMRCSLYFSKPYFERDLKYTAWSELYFKGKYIEMYRVTLHSNPFLLYFIHMAPLSKL